MVVSENFSHLPEDANIIIYKFITARNEGNIFRSVWRVSRILFTGEGGLQAHTKGIGGGSGRGGVSRPTPRKEVEGSGRGRSPGPRPGGGWGVWLGGLQAHTQGGGFGGLAGEGLQTHTWGVSMPRGVSQHALSQTPPSRRLLLRAARILLECILVIYIFCY